MTDDQSEKLKRLRNATELKYSIRNDALYSLMTYGDTKTGKNGFGENWNSQQTSGPRTVLTWLIMQALNIERLPWLHDRVFTEALPEDPKVLEVFWDALRDPGHLAEMVDEMREIHAYTTATLKRFGLGQVTLIRKVADWGTLDWVNPKNGYASRLASMASAAAYLRRQDITLPVDVLSSWGTGGYPERPVALERTFNADEIAWCWILIASRDPTKGAAVEEGEWVVVCKDREGLMQMPADGIKVPAGFQLPGPSQSSGTAMVTGLNIHASFHPKSQEEAEERLKKGGLAYGPQTSAYRDEPFLREAQLRLSLSDRLKKALKLIVSGSQM